MHGSLTFTLSLREYIISRRLLNFLKSLTIFGTYILGSTATLIVYIFLFLQQGEIDFHLQDSGYFGISMYP